MNNPFRKNERYPGAPSVRPKAPPSAEEPMPSPGTTPRTKDLPVDKPAAPPSAETPMKPPAKPAKN